MNEKRPSDRSFGLIFAALFLIIAGIGFFAFDQIVLWAFGISAVMMILSLVMPSILMPLNRIWMSLSDRIAFVMNHVLLGVFFFFVVTPFGLAARIFGGISFRKAPDPHLESYWNDVGRRADADTYPDMF